MKVIFFNSANMKSTMKMCQIGMSVSPGNAETPARYKAES